MAERPDAATQEAEARLSALAKGLRILRAVARRGTGVTATEVAAALDLPVPTVHRLLAVLEAEGWVSRAEDRAFAVGPELLLTAATVAGRDGFATGVRAELKAIVREVRETACLNLVDRRSWKLVVAMVEEPPLPLSYRLSPGDESSLHAGASGKAALAFLPDGEIAALVRRGLPRLTADTVTDPDALQADLARIRALGYAVSVGERLAGAMGIAAPVFGAGGIYGSLLVTVPLFRHEDHDRASLIAAVTRHAGRISQLLPLRGA